MPPMPMIRKNPNGIFWSSLLWIIRCQEANSPLRDAAIPPSHRAKVKILATENGSNMGWSWHILTYIKYHQVLSLLTTVCKKKTAKDAVQWPKQNYPMLHVLELCNLCCKKGLSTLHDTPPNVINIFSRVKLETPAASFASDTIEIHRISSYTTLPVSKN